MSIFNSNKLSKSELLELVIAQKKEIERLEFEVDSLNEQLELKEKNIKDMSSLEHITNKLFSIANMIDLNKEKSGEDENG